MITDREFNPMIVEHLPDRYADVREVQVVSDLLKKELASVNSNIVRVARNRFDFMRDEESCSRWEKILNIKIDDSYTLDERRINIALKRIGDRPYTEKKLRYVLENLVGKNGYTLEVDNIDFTVKVKLALTVKNNYKTISEMLEGMTPLMFVLYIDLMYNKNKVLAKYKNEDLAKLTNLQLREESETKWQF